MHLKPRLLNNDEVISTQEGGRFLISHDTFKVVEVLMFLKQAISARDAKAFVEGITCEVLSPGGSKWQKGKVKISVEFCPFEDELPKDSLSDDKNSDSSASALEEIRCSIE